MLEEIGGRGSFKAWRIAKTTDRINSSGSYRAISLSRNDLSLSSLHGQE